jgi:hypothetical protein
MAKFNINGIWYEAKTYAEARALAATARPAAGPAPALKPGPPPALKPPQPSVPQALSKPSLNTGVKPLPTVPDAHAKPALPPKPVPRVAPPPKVADSKPGAQSFDLRCYRGEKNNWWSPPEERLICGMTLYQPWNLQVGINSMTDLWEHLRKFIQENCFGKVDAFAQYLRAQGRPFALATARTTSGSYTSDYNYVIKVPNARTFLWGPKLTLGAQVQFKETTDVTADYIVLNADTIAASTILAFGHKCGTYEVTFLHDLGLGYIETINNRRLDPGTIKSQTALSLEEKVKLRKYLRHGTSWLG